MSVTSAIIGSSSGIGRALVELHREQNIGCIAFSRIPEELEGVTTFELDLTREKESSLTLEKALTQFPNIEHFFLVSGTGDIESDPDYEIAKSTTSLNCNGFTLAAYKIANYLEKRGSGSLVAVTSAECLGYHTER